jgi:hypothetical protein
MMMTMKIVVVVEERFHKVTIDARNALKVDDSDE